LKISQLENTGPFHPILNIHTTHDITCVISWYHVCEVTPHDGLLQHDRQNKGRLSWV